jgi:hypothetical protein
VYDLHASNFAFRFGAAELDSNAGTDSDEDEYQ